MNNPWKCSKKTLEKENLGEILRGNFENIAEWIVGDFLGEILGLNVENCRNS